MIRVLALVLILAPSGTWAVSSETERVCKTAGEMGLHFTSAVTAASAYLLLSIQAAEADGEEPSPLAIQASETTKELMKQASEKMSELSGLCGLE